MGSVANFPKAANSVSLTVHRANDRCIQEKRKTITGDDILYAMTTLGFDAYVEPLKLYLQKYREVSIHGFSTVITTSIFPLVYEGR